jgi:hypothetical protein
MSFNNNRPAKQVYHDLGTFVAARTLDKNTKNGVKKYVEIQYKPTTGPKAGEIFTRGAFADSLKNSVNTLKALREGDELTLKVTINEVGDKKYRNLQAVVQGHIAAPKSAPSGGTSYSSNAGGIAKGDYNTRAARGQALNLAMTVAIAEGRQSDDAYILSLVPRMIKLGEAVQNDTNIESTASVSTTPQAAVQAQPTQAQATSSFKDDEIDFGTLDL